MNHYHRGDNTTAAALAPLQCGTPTCWTVRPRGKHRGAAVVTALKHQSMFGRAVPEVLTDRGGSRPRKGFVCCHDHPPFSPLVVERAQWLR